MNFILQKKSSNSFARAAEIHLAHGCVKTPIFMPVGTQGSVKALDFNDLLSLGASIILGNTYHLYLRPGVEIMREAGGLHKFSGYPLNFLTDSGGFQAFSMLTNVKEDKDGIYFKSHLDGSSHFFTPKKVLEIQYALNSDIMMVLDDLVGLPASSDRILKSIDKTTRWAQQSLDFHNLSKKEGIGCNQALFCINQGGISKEFRQKSARDLVSLGEFDGYAIGGLSVGESNEAMYDTIELVTPLLPENKPRYLMGVGTPRDILEGIMRGVDMFDCVMPTRNARNGTLFVSFGKVNIKKAEYKADFSPLDEKCECYTCKNHSRSYLHHLFKARELSYFSLASLHNLHYYLTLVKNAREAILEDRFLEFYKEFCNQTQAD